MSVTCFSYIILTAKQYMWIT